MGVTNLAGKQLAHCRYATTTVARSIEWETSQTGMRALIHSQCEQIVSLKVLSIKGLLLSWREILQHWLTSLAILRLSAVTAPSSLFWL